MKTNSIMDGSEKAKEVQAIENGTLDTDVVYKASWKMMVRLR